MLFESASIQRKLALLVLSASLFALVLASVGFGIYERATFRADITRELSTLADTLGAGAGLCDEEAVRILVDEGPGRVHELIALGVEFDRESSGSLSLAREGGHSRPRVVHA